ncbi:hypothetical protein RJ639_027498 [Escallonia herrerae]|uniref:BHLH domain-containing protein n=1 Tax=Escallonia herrerae TaxID=1293975 RepID=A0AA89BFG1_9ASTE|nr:hypothetical protein RJ639_027498 [Escallonia herrerae]
MRGKEVKVEGRGEEDINRLFLGIMEGYKDSAIPPLTDFVPPAGGGGMGVSVEKGSSSKRGNRGRGGGEKDYLQRERDRRDKMAEKFRVLQSMVPNLYHKATREAIVNNAIDYITKLEEEKSRLENLKKSISPESMEAKPILSYCTNRNSNVDVTISGGVAFFGIQLAAQRCLVVKVFGVFDKHGADVLAANVSVNDQRQLTLTVTAMVGGSSTDSIEKIKRDILRI